jgi:competence protein ComEC
MTLFLLGLAWLAGIAIGQTSSLATWQWLILSAGAFLGTLVFRRQRNYRWTFFALLVLTLGAARLQAAKPSFGPDHVASFNDRDCYVTLTGVIVTTPDVRDTYTGLRLSTEHLTDECGQGSQTIHGQVLLRAPRSGDWAYGDRMRAHGTLETPPVFETFSYRDYLARQGIHSLMPNAEVTRLARRQANPVLQLIFNFRAHALGVVYALFPDPEASLLAGILLGIESGISPEVRQAFNQTSTTHIIAISGFNVTIIAALFLALFRRWLGALRGALAAGVAIAVYTVLVGADATVVRAAIMGGVALLARYLGRQTHGLASLSCAAILMTAVNPYILMDVGFQLSFAATLGLILYAEPLKVWSVRLMCRWMPEDQAERMASPISEFVLFTLAAQLTTLPIITYYIRRLSLVSWLANPVILPLQPPVMILGGLATLAGTLWLPLGRPLAWVAWPFIAATIRMVEFFAQWPLAAIPLGRVSVLVVAGFYLLLFGVTVSARLPPEWRQKTVFLQTIFERLKLPTMISLAVLVVLTGLVWQVVVDKPDGRLHLTVLDVGNGDAAIIQSPTGRFVLVDGGPSPIALSEALGRRLPLLDRQIDWVVIAGTHDDQIAGLEGVTERFPIGNVLLAGPPGRSAYRQLMDTLTEENVPITSAQQGQVLDLGGGAQAEVIAVGGCGAVLSLTHGQARILLASGADPDLVLNMSNQRAIGPVTAVLLPDGGYEAVNPPEWLAQLEPWIAMISVQAGNSRGLPSPDVLDSLTGTTVLRTDLHGWIELTSDGENLWVEVERLPDEDTAH